MKPVVCKALIEWLKNAAIALEPYVVVHKSSKVR